jgi:hypothetical protein
MLKYTREVNDAAHQHPWPFITGVSLGAWVLGVTLRNRDK